MKQSSNKKSWLWLGGVLLVFVIAMFIIEINQPKDYPSYVSESPSPTGTKAFYTYLEENYDEVNRWNHEPELLLNEENDPLLMMVGPSFVPETKTMTDYENFMHAGNTIVLWQHNVQGMFDLKTTPIMQGLLPEESLENVITDDKGKTYDAEVLSTVRLEIEEDDQVLLSDSYGTLALKRSFGQGELIVALTPDWLTNEVILNNDNLPLVFSLMDNANVSANAIVFDEYVHTPPSTAKTLSVYPTYFLIFMLQAAFVTLIWLWYRGKRFGPVLTVREDTVRFSDEGIIALSAWYLRGRRYQESLTIQADYVKFRLQESWGLPYTKDWIDLVDSLERKWQHMKRTDIQTFVTGLKEVLMKQKISKQEYLLWTKRIDQLRREVDEG